MNAMLEAQQLLNFPKEHTEAGGTSLKAPMCNGHRVLQRPKSKAWAVLVPK
jgi:hypothetical protein